MPIRLGCDQAIPQFLLKESVGFAEVVKEARDSRQQTDYFCRMPAIFICRGKFQHLDCMFRELITCNQGDEERGLKR